MNKATIFSETTIVRWGRLALLIFLCYNIIWIPVLSEEDGITWGSAARCMMVDFLFCAIISMFNCVMLGILNRRMPLSDWSNRRIAVAIIGISLFNILICFPLSAIKWWLYNKIFAAYPWSMEENYIDTYVMSSVTSIIIVSYMLIWVTSSLRQKEKFLAEAKIKALKNQINPHFLFNNLNAGIALIDYDPEQAVDFFTAMSRVFRSVLDRSMETLQPLEKELEDIEQYLKLLRIRLGNAIKMDCRLSENDGEKMILSGSLQLVFENIVKHNRFSIEEPMNIIIHTKDDVLEIVNDYRPLSDKTASHGIGQSALIQRYEDFGRHNISFHKDGDRYISQLPLFNER